MEIAPDTSGTLLRHITPQPCFFHYHSRA
uniref:Uncharacterized protein n=1 Tax=Anguilla anguilla TaxID=7936 RepID=A0A0E9QV14_ANGAN